LKEVPEFILMQLVCTEPILKSYQNSIIITHAEFYAITKI